jgi:hypothetical protein
MRKHRIKDEGGIRSSIVSIGGLSSLDRAIEMLSRTVNEYYCIIIVDNVKITKDGRYVKIEKYKK